MVLKSTIRTAILFAPYICNLFLFPIPIFSNIVQLLGNIILKKTWSENGCCDHYKNCSNILSTWTFYSPYLFMLYVHFFMLLG